jgi:hypothetical protein
MIACDGLIQLADAPMSGKDTLNLPLTELQVLNNRLALPSTVARDFPRYGTPTIP